MSDPFAGGQWTVYNPAPGTDPVWDAYLATYTAKAKMADIDAQRQRDLLAQSHTAARATLDEQTPGRRRDLEGSLLAAGVGRSSRAMRNRSDLESDIVRSYQSADDSYRAGSESIDSTYARLIAEMAAEREGAIAESRLRLLGDGKSVPGSDTPGGTTSPGYTKPKAKPKSVASPAPKAPTSAPYKPPTAAPPRVTPPPSSRRNPTGGGRYNY